MIIRIKLRFAVLLVAVAPFLLGSKLVAEEHGDNPVVGSLPIITNDDDKMWILNNLPINLLIYIEWESGDVETLVSVKDSSGTTIDGPYKWGTGVPKYTLSVPMGGALLFNDVNDPLDDHALGKATAFEDN